MTIGRRSFLAQTGLVIAAPLVWPRVRIASFGTGETMYGLIGKMTAVPEQRDALAAILLEGTGSMPGCLSYVVATDTSDPDALWITEVWESQASHHASLSLPAVQEAIAKGRPLIAGFSNRVETTPLGGHGLKGGTDR